MTCSKAKQVSMRGVDWLGQPSGTGRMEYEDIPVCISRIMMWLVDGASRRNATRGE